METDRNILVVDDDKEILVLEKEILTINGYSVFSALNGNDALKILKAKFIPVIFLDLQLPDINGIELCRKIREFNQVAWICAITGKSALFEIAECREAGFDDYITKPLDSDLYITIIQEAFRKFERWSNFK